MYLQTFCFCGVGSRDSTAELGSLCEFVLMFQTTLPKDSRDAQAYLRCVQTGSPTFSGALDAIY